MRSGFGRIDDDIQRRARRIRHEQGEQAAQEFEAREYERAAGGLVPIGTGAAIGAAVGSIVPGIGTAIGFAIGAYLGGGAAIYKDHLDSKK
ncbi:hypothetical protein [Sphingomonas sp. G-3-2-10]|uniref:hypothetical protein n=1 Tax=Sphingomonas sp. G-3-2-10 TaxID=2728838 RepID=UPI00146D0DB2|nr:hypothetical protein [Sphingomonas sp. G-3-2-10]NML07241.1 hypothetical protein [Sphingomonas sp. G-3-2-10]